jgi:hypothetical protein
MLTITVHTVPAPDHGDDNDDDDDDVEHMVK